jgi:hypothetical protein
MYAAILPDLLRLIASFAQASSCSGCRPDSLLVDVFTLDYLDHLRF